VTREQLAVSGDCRDLRHAWYRDGDTVLVRRYGRVRQFARQLTCIRCGTTRADEYKVSGDLVPRTKVKYVYPPGYLIPGGISVADVRRILFGGRA